MTETLVEFLAPLAESGHRDRCLATLYHMERFEGATDGVPVGEIRERLVRARAPGARTVNVPRELSSAGHYAHIVGKGKGNVNLWQLTNSGRKYVRELLALSEESSGVEQDVTELVKLATRISDEVVRGYVDEAILCLRVNALRAAVVFLWTGAIRHLQEEMLSDYGAKATTAAIQKHDPRVKRVSKIEDFASVNDKSTLIGMRELGLLDKGEWTTLGEALDLRNRCGHPTRYRPGIKRASSYIEDVTGIVFD